ncbi:MAG: choice-of-anchor J domain-containing protein [Chloroherpetonaceae bacterium]|nr:choice-of-anchor J domain-containing protein [Chloroherpetonaceae bacterium]MDW8437583.1 choice-of-anchor J domain-containing protein [Chloroherpetonaceae bacterium]
MSLSHATSRLAVLLVLLLFGATTLAQEARPSSPAQATDRASSRAMKELEEQRRLHQEADKLRQKALEEKAREERASAAQRNDAPASKARFSPAPKDYVEPAPPRLPQPIYPNTSGSNSVIFFENFEGVPVTGNPGYTTALPPGWVAVDYNTSTSGGSPVSFFGRWQTQTNRRPNPSRPGGTKSAMYQWHSDATSPGDDYLFTPQFSATAGNRYRLTFFYHSAYFLPQNPFSETFRVVLTTDTTNTSIVSVILPTTPPIQDTSWIAADIEFIAPQSGNLRIGFHCNSPPDQDRLYIDDVRLESLAPPAANDLTVADIQPRATIATIPTTLRVRFRNIGLNAISDPFKVYWSLDGVLQDSATVNAPLAIGQSDSVSFNWANPQTGARQVRAWVNLPADTVRANDTLAVTVNVLPDKDLTATGVRVIGSLSPNQPAQVQVRFRNLGAPQSNFTIGYRVDNGAPVTQTYSGTLGTNQVDSVTLTTPFTPTQGGQINIKGFVSLLGDANPANDTISANFFVEAAVAQWSEGFENALFPPEGWRRFNLDGGAQQWERYTAAPIFGTASASVRWESSTLANDDWLITRKTAATDSSRLSFFATGSNSFTDSVEIRVSTTGFEPANFTQKIATVRPVGAPAQRFEFSLAPWAGQDIYIAFRYKELDELRLTIDSVQVFLVRSQDVGATSITGVPANAPLNQPIVIRANVRNFGSQPVSNVPVFYRVNNGAPVGPVTIPGPIAPLDSATAVFDGEFRFTPTAGGLYTIRAYSQLPNDANAANDTARFTFFVDTPTPTWSEGFEGTTFPPLGWSVYNLDGGLQQWTRYTVTPIFGSASASVRWESSTLANNDWLVTRQTSVSSLSRLAFWAKRQSTTYPDSLIVWVSTSGSDPSNPANFTNVIARIAPSTTAERYVINLAPFEAQDIYIGFQYKELDDFRIYLDSVEVFEASATDLRVVRMILPTTDVKAGTPYPVTMEIENVGTQPVAAGYPVRYSINNGAPVTVNAGPALNPGQTATFTFTGANAWVPSGEGVYSVTCSVNAPNDGNPANNSATTGGIYIFPAQAVLFTGFNDSTQFFNGPNTNLIVPSGWLTINNDGGGATGPWFVHNPSVFPVFEGRRCVAANFAGANPPALGPIDEWLVLPPQTRGAATTFDSLIFYIRRTTSNYPDSIKIMVSPTGSAAVSAFNEIAYVRVPNDWTRFAFRVSDGVPTGSNYRVAIRYFIVNGGQSGANSDYIAVDALSFATYGASSIGGDAPFVPKSFALAQNYPNPFNPSTIIQYDVAKAGRVTIEVFNVLGQKVETLVDEVKAAGRYSVAFNAKNLASGTYFCRMTAAGGEFSQTMKMLFLK